MAAMASCSQRSAPANQPRAAQGRPRRPGPAALQLLDHPGGQGGVPVAGGLGQLGPPGPGQPVGQGGQGPGHGQQGRPLDPGRGVLVLVQGAQQKGVDVEQVA